MLRAGPDCHTVPQMDLEDCLRKQADQLFELARKTADPELRREIEEMAQACLAELEAIDQTKH